MSSANAPLVVVMGVSGSGKSTVGPLLARQLTAEFLEGEHLHPQRNQERMAAGIALTENDRRDWMLEIASQLADARAGHHALVIACAALRRADRDMLRTAAPQLAFVHLEVSPTLLAERLPLRHVVPNPPLPQQLAMLELPRTDERAIAFDAALKPGDIASQATTWIRQWKGEPPRRK